MNALLNEALRLAELGIKVLPLRSRDKRPITENGVWDATTDTTLIQAWWKENPTANVGMSCEGFLVVDIDGYKREEDDWPGDAGHAGDLMTCPQARTPRKGDHFVMRDPKQEFGNTTSKLAKGIDTRGTGGYIAVYPSEGAGGTRYSWIRGIDDLDEVPEVFPWLREQLNAIKRGKFDGDSPFLGDRPIPDGEQNDTLTRIGGWLRQHGFSQGQIEAALIAVSEERCVDAAGKPWPHPEERVKKIAWSVSRYEPDVFRVSAMEDAPPEVEKDTFADPGRFPPHLLDEAPGFLGEVMDFCLETSPRPQPVFALAGAMTLLSTLMGRKVRDEENLRPNILAMIVGRSGSGKDRPRQVNREILDAIGAAEELLGSEEIQSGNGVYTTARTQPCCLLQLDEMGKMLQRIKQSRSDALANVVSTIMKLYSAAGGPCKIGGYADPKRNFALEQPHMTVLGTTVVESFAQSLTTEALHDGFLSRVLLFSSAEFPLDVPFKHRPPPQRILDMAADWYKFQPTTGNLISANPDPKIFVYTPAALEAVEEFRVFSWKLSREHTLWTRAMEKAKKVAQMHTGATHGPGAETISERAFRWASQMVEYQTREMLWIASQWVSDSYLEAQTKRVVRWLRKKTGRISLSQFTRAHQSIAKKMRQEILETLQQTGQLVLKKESSRTYLELKDD